MTLKLRKTENFGADLTRTTAEDMPVIAAKGPASRSREKPCIDVAGPGRTRSYYRHQAGITA